MTIEEVFVKLIAHLVKGTIIHDQLSQIYGFLNFTGYQKEQEKQYEEEHQKYRDIRKYYLDHYQKLLPEFSMERVNLIPNSWLKYSKSDVDTNTRRSTLKETLKKWVDWEQETKKLLEELFLELYNLKEIGAMLKVSQLLEGVEEELQYARYKQTKLSSVDYDIIFIMEEQEEP